MTYRFKRLIISALVYFMFTPYLVITGSPSVVSAADSAPAATIGTKAVAVLPDLEYIGEYRITAYSYEEGDGENYGTAGGYTPIPYYTIAATSEFEFGTVLFIEGVGFVQVQDRGGFPEGTLDLHIGHDNPDEFDTGYKEVYLVDY